MTDQFFPEFYIRKKAYILITGMCCLPDSINCKD